MAKLERLTRSFRRIREQSHYRAVNCAIRLLNNDSPVFLPFNSQKQTRQEKRKKINLIWLTSAVSSLKLNQFTYGGCHRCSFPRHNLKDKRLKKENYEANGFSG